MIDYGALGGLLVFVPYALIVTKGYEATQAGAALLLRCQGEFEHRKDGDLINAEGESR